MSVSSHGTLGVSACLMIDGVSTSDQQINVQVVSENC